MVLAPCCMEAMDHAGEGLVGIAQWICTVWLRGSKALPPGESRFIWLKQPTTGFKQKHTIISLRCVLLGRAVPRFPGQFCTRGFFGDEASVITPRIDVPLVTLC